LGADDARSSGSSPVLTAMNGDWSEEVDERHLAGPDGEEVDEFGVRNRHSGRRAGGSSLAFAVQPLKNLARGGSPTESKEGP
jgi:hypothetical protein